MSAVETPTRRPNGHDIPRKSPVAEIDCPYCGQPISRKEYGEIQAKIADEERARIGKVEADLKARFARETAQIEGKAKKDAAKAAEAQIKALKESLEPTIAARLEAQREIHEKTVNAAVLGERTKHIGEKLALEGQVDEMKRRLQSLTAHQRGEPAEVDLHTALETALPADKVWRTVKGQKGTDVTVEVVHEGAVVGRICLDSKNHARWSNTFTRKLRADQLTEKADFAILSTSVFPAGERELALRDHVIIASPQRVVVIVHLLRRMIVENHRLKLSSVARSQKADELYAYILSPTCSDLMDRIVKLANDMTVLEQSESDTHRKVWAKRADLIRAIVDIHGEFTGSVSAIIAGEAA